MRLKYMWLCVAVLLLASSPAYAQGGGTTAALSGQVTDAQGAIIPGADVVAKNNATSSESRAVTDTEGRFTIPALNPGIYTVTVSLSGFKTAVLPDVQILTATPASITVKLEIGAVEETVVVRGATEVLQTQTAAVQTTINVQQISSLPLTTRTALDYVTALPGAITQGSNSRGTKINGLPGVSINITLDGVNVQDNNNRGPAGGQTDGDGFFMFIRPLMDSVEEITVSTSTPEAANSGQGAAQIRMTTRAGTSRFSGSVYDTWRNQAGTSDSDVNSRNNKIGWLWRLNTPYWFNKRDRPRTNAGDYFIDDVRLETPGFRVGGPIFTNNLTYFFNWEWFKWPNQVARTRFLMNEAARAGNFTYLATDGSTRTINLLNLVPGSTTDPTTAKLFADMRTAAAGQTTGGAIAAHDLNTDRFDYSPGGDQRRHFPTGRLDYNVTPNHRLTSTLRYNRFESDPDILNNREPRFPGFANQGGQYSHRYMWQGTVRSTFGKNIVNEARYGFAGGTLKFFTDATLSQFDCTGLGCQGAYQLGTNVRIGGGGNDLTSATNTNGANTRNVPDTVYEDTLTWLKGKHTFSVGGTYTKIRFENWDQPGGVVPAITFGVNSADLPAFNIISDTNAALAMNATTAGWARNMFAVLTGRVTQVGGTFVLDDAGNYNFLGERWQKGSMDEVGLFISDSWRMRPNFTLTAGLRYELQLPFKPDFSSFSRLADWTQIYGLSGAGNLFKPGTLTGTAPSFNQYLQGESAYNTDYNNFGPSVGFTWQPSLGDGLFSKILSSEPVFRGGYSVSFDRFGTGEFTGIFGANAGATRAATRSLTLTGPANLNADNLGLPVLLRDTTRLSPFAAPSLSYPLVPAVNESVNVMHPDLYVPYTHQYSIGWQRELGKDMAVELRYIGNQNVGGWTTTNLNATGNWNIKENGFYEEYRLAQRNLAANIAAGRGTTFAYTGAPGTSPLPIFAAYLHGIPLNDARNQNPATYTNALFANSAWYNQLAVYNANITGIAGTGTNGLQNSARAANATAAGLPANFFQVNPSIGQANANLMENGGTIRYDAMQLELRRRLKSGLLVQGSYVYGKRSTWTRPSLRDDFIKIPSTGAVGGVDHALKFNWIYQLPFGKDRRFGGNAGKFLDAIIGGWEVDGIARFQSGQRFNIAGVRLVGMTEKDVQNMFKFSRRPDADGVTRIYMFPEDVIDQSILAFNGWSATHPSGYTNGVVPTGKYFAPADSPDCVQFVAGDCAPISIPISAPWFGKTDMSFVKRFSIGGSRTIEARMDLYNVFDNINFTPLGVQTGATRSAWEVTTSARDLNASQDAGGRITSFGLRFSW